MKKLGKFLVAGALAAVACVGLVACGGGNSGYNGEYKYENTYTPGSYYGAKVNVKIKDITTEEKDPVSGKTIKVITGGEIVSITVEADTDNYHNITPTWKENAHEGDLGYDKTVAALPDYLKKFEGMTVKDIMQINVDVKNSVPSDISNAELKLTGATQTSGRIILAVQAAIGDTTSITELPAKGTWAYHVLEDAAKKAGMTVDEYVEFIKDQMGGITG